ncbi:MAG: MarR family transcriptional regulator [Hormoscilla sp. GUM202]|nr:MarR family transcriptional regulator [Hormoscilla sp. GUM202]
MASLLSKWLEERKKRASERRELHIRGQQEKRARVSEVRSRQRETKEFLSQKHQERRQMRAQLQSELHQYRRNLRRSVWGTNAEAQVIDIIQNKSGVRITEIQETLGITRVQAVDTVNSLKEKGLVVDRDRQFFLP